jgi:uncharacterized protein (TIGR00255 family)
MAIRSMTAFAQAKAAVSSADGVAAPFTISLKSVNHRFLDLHFRLPAESDAIEMKLRQLLKEKLGRGHVDVSLSFEASSGGAVAINRELVGGYLRAFRAAAKEFAISGEPDLNMVLRVPGALAGGSMGQNGDLETAVMEAAQQVIARLETMRAEEGRTIEHELRERMARLLTAAEQVEKLRGAVVQAQLERARTRIQEMLGAATDQNRILQEAAIWSERSDVQEEVVRMKAHVQHFLGLLAGSGEAGKKLDFLLQEMNREANTMLSKTTGIAGDGLKITELGLAMKSEIEKAREQVQNVE